MPLKVAEHKSFIFKNTNSLMLLKEIDSLNTDNWRGLDKRLINRIYFGNVFSRKEAAKDLLGRCNSVSVENFPLKLATSSLLCVFFLM